jgi:hypothetical protein
MAHVHLVDDAGRQGEALEDEVVAGDVAQELRR